MTITDWLSAGWPVFLGGITLVVVLAQMYTRISVLEDKIKSAFSILNGLGKRDR
jgi:hypothetical protein